MNKPPIMKEKEANAMYEFLTNHSYLKLLKEPLKKVYGKANDYMNKIFNPVKDKLIDIYKNSNYIQKLEDLVDHYKTNTYNKNKDEINYQFNY